MQKTAKRRNKIIAAVLAAVLLLGAVTLWALLDDKDGSFENTLGSPLSQSGESAGFRASFIDVGQGDCILIECDGKTMLVDGGEKIYGQTVARYLFSRNIKTLDYIVATHPHSDHIGSLSYIFDTFGAKNVIMPRIQAELIPTNYFFDEFVTSVGESRANVIATVSGYAFMLGSAEIRVVGPLSETADELNNLSAVLKITYGETSILLTGDASFAEEDEIIASGENIDCDILKVGHHGSSASSGEEFLKKVSPAICVISCGADNDYGHPADSTLRRLSEYTDKIYRTDRCGTITAVSDGKKFTMKTDRGNG